MFIFYVILKLKVCSYHFVHVSLLYWSFVQLFLQVSAGVFWSLPCIRDILLFKHCSCVRDWAIIGSFSETLISPKNSNSHNQTPQKKNQKNQEHMNIHPSSYKSEPQTWFFYSDSNNNTSKHPKSEPNSAKSEPNSAKSEPQTLFFISDSTTPPQTDPNAQKKGRRSKFEVFRTISFPPFPNRSKR